MIASVKDKETILALREQLNEFRTALIEAIERIKELEEELKLKGQLKYDGIKWWIIKEDDSKEGPFCQICWDDRGKLVHLQPNLQLWKCGICKQNFDRKDGEITPEDRHLIEKKKSRQ